LPAAPAALTLAFDPQRSSGQSIEAVHQATASVKPLTSISNMMAISRWER